jgi:hypothetical protein
MTPKSDLLKNRLLTKIEPYLNISETEKQNVANSTSSSKIIKKYFKTLNKIKKMDIALRQLDEFDNFWNSEILWTYSIDKIVSKIKHITEQIEGEIILRNRNLSYTLDSDFAHYSIFISYY